MVLFPRAFPARHSRRALGRFPSHGSAVAGSDPHFAFASQGSFPLSGFPGRAVAKANDPCHPGMASATAAKYPRQSWLLKQPGALLHGIHWTADPGDGKVSVARIVGSVPLSDVSVTSAQRGCTTCKIQRAK
jgi:hypothetical protein